MEGPHGLPDRGRLFPGAGWVINLSRDEQMSAPRSLLHSQVSELLAIEGDFQEALKAQSKLDALDSQFQALLSTLQAQAVSQRQGLEDYLHANGLEPAISPSPIAGVLQLLSSPNELSHLISADYAAFNYAAHRYSVLVELALRLYDPALRELAPKHLRTYTRAALMFNHVLPASIVGELNREGLDCRCVCPMCSIGACGCLAAGRHFINAAWRESEPEISSETGFLVTSPRRDSQLAQSGVRSGDRLLQVDGRVIQTFTDVQAAIREHKLGGEAVFRIARGLEPPRDIQVRHVSDYATG